MRYAIAILLLAATAQSPLTRTVRQRAAVRVRTVRHRRIALED